MLIDEIDAPIIRTIALFNLAGMPTSWSCCGFNYRRQPETRSHSYGRPFVTIPCFNHEAGIVKMILELIDDDLFSSSRIWHCSAQKAPRQGIAFQLSCFFGAGDWTDKDCIHMYERPLMAIGQLNDRLVTVFGKKLKDEVLLNDFNGYMRSETSFLGDWQVEPSDPWLIKKTDYI